MPKNDFYVLIKKEKGSTSEFMDESLFGDKDVRKDL